jgi:hypothetical protein
MLKRFFVVLVVLFGLGMSANAQSLYNGWYNVQENDGSWKVRDQNGALKFYGKAFGVSGCRYNVQESDGSWKVRDQNGTLKFYGRVELQISGLLTCHSKSILYGVNRQNENVAIFYKIG